MSKFATNSLALGISLFGGMAAAFVTIKVLTNSLTSEDYGRYVTALAFSNITSILFELGGTRVVARYVAHYEALGQRGASIGTVWLYYGTTILLATVFVAAMVFGGGAFLAANLYHDTSLIAPLILAVLATSVITLINLTLAAFNGRQQMMVSSAISLAMIALPASIYLLKSSQLDVTSALAIMLIVDLALFVVAGIWLNRDLMNKADRRAVVSPSRLIGNLGSYWLSAGVLTILSLLFNYSDRFIISMALPFQFVAFYNVANNIHLMSKRVLAIPLGAVSPILTTAWSQNQRDQMAQISRLIAKSILILGMLFAVMIVALAVPLIYLVSNSNYLAAVPVLILLSASVPLLCITSPISTALQAIGIMKPVVIAEIVYVGTYVILNILFVGPWGISGVAMSQLVSTSIVFIIYIVVVSRYNIYKFSFQELARVVLSALFVGTLPYLGRWIVGALPPIVELAVYGTVCCLVYYVLLVVTGTITPQDRDGLARLVSRPWLSRLIIKAYDVPRSLFVRQSFP